MKPKQDDYQIIIQNAKDNISYVEIIFYNDQTYHEPVRRAKTNGENQIETTAGDLNKLSFNFGNTTLFFDNINTSSTITHKYSSTWSIRLFYNLFGHYFPCIVFHFSYGGRHHFRFFLQQSHGHFLCFFILPRFVI